MKRKYKYVTKEEINYLRSNYGKVETIKIAKKLGRSLDSIWHIVRGLNLHFSMKMAGKIYRKDKSWEELYGDKVAKKMRRKLFRRCNGKNYLKIYGKEKSESIKAKQSKNNCRHREEFKNLAVNSCELTMT